MERCFFEGEILRHYELFCMSFTHKWLRRHNFTNYANIWEDALQCARLGFLLYLRAAKIERAEDVQLYDNKALYWRMYKELSNGVFMEAMAPCGVHRPVTKVTSVKYHAVPLTEAGQNDELSANLDLSSVTVDSFLQRLHGSERQLVSMRLAGIKPPEIQKQLGLSTATYYRRVKRLRERWKEQYQI